MERIINYFSGLDYINSLSSIGQLFFLWLFFFVLVNISVVVITKILFAINIVEDISENLFGNIVIFSAIWSMFIVAYLV